jgi:hypothetical protein
LVKRSRGHQEDGISVKLPSEFAIWPYNLSNSSIFSELNILFKLNLQLQIHKLAQRNFEAMIIWYDNQRIEQLLRLIWYLNWYTMTSIVLQ